ncbi:MAG: Ig-like domain-containing protein [Gammaproteobacteria bacterium]
MNHTPRLWKNPTATACLLVCLAAVGCNGVGRKTILGAPGVTATPTVTVTSPAPGATGVLISSLLTVTFSEAMDATTLTPTSISVACPTGMPVAATVDYNAATSAATLTPLALLPPTTVCTATVTTAAKSSLGNVLAADYVWSFTTGGVLASTIRPTVVLTVPDSGATLVPTNSLVLATFSESMNPATINDTSFTVVTTLGGTAVAGAVTYDDASRTAVFTPAANLAINTQFTATITMAATDMAGNALAGNPALLPAAGNYVWTFTTSAVTDTTPPTVTLVSPANGASAACRTTVVSATFSETMDPTTINALTFGVTAAGVAVSGSVSYNTATRVATFTPTAATGFAAGTLFTATVKSGAAGVKDGAGNQLAADDVWTFTTGTTACAAPVNLGTAANFGGLGGTAGITNQGVNTVVHLNLATTAVCTGVTGFHDASNVYTETPLNVGAVNSTIDCSPPAPGTATTAAIAATALNDSQIAYNYLMNLPPGAAAAQLGATTLAPGTYTSATTVDITTGNLTLDAQGDANAMWVFQVGSSLTVGAPGIPRSVLLINGAQAKNVYWQVGAAARIEVASTMVGTIIAMSGVTISTAGTLLQTTLTGRALSLVSSVTMVNTTINAP